MSEELAEEAKGDVEVPISVKFWTVLRPFFTTMNKDRAKAWVWLLAMIALLMLESLVLVAFSYTQVCAIVVRN